jgi:ABC-2 type transport system ATP-binding protein
MRILEVEKLRKEYGALVAVKDVSFTVEEGQVVGLIGPNGAGKTTLLRMLATLLEPTDGSVRVLGLDLARDYLRIRERLGFLPDFFNLYNDLTARETLTFFARAYRVPPAEIPGRVEQVLSYVDLTEKRDEFVHHLSRGMVQRMGVAALLVHSPDLFLLDEPASGLDPKARIDLRQVLRRLSSEGKTVVISSHILTELADFCTHITIMNRGEIPLGGSVDEIRRSLGGARRIRIGVLAGADRAADRVARAGGRILETRENTLLAELACDLEALAALNADLVRDGLKVVSFAEEKSTIEDVFMKISGGETEAPK